MGVLPSIGTHGALEHPSPGHFDTLSVYPTMGRGQQRRDNRSDIVGHPGAPQSCLRRDESIHLRYVAQRPSAEISFDSAGRDDIHGYVALTQFLREIAREHLDRTLQGSIYGKARQSDPRKAA